MQLLSFCCTLSNLGSRETALNPSSYNFHFIFLVKILSSLKGAMICFFTSLFYWYPGCSRGIVSPDTILPGTLSIRAELLVHIVLVFAAQRYYILLRQPYPFFNSLIHSFSWAHWFSADTYFRSIYSFNSPPTPQKCGPLTIHGGPPTFLPSWMLDRLFRAIDGVNTTLELHLFYIKWMPTSLSNTFSATTSNYLKISLKKSIWPYICSYETLLLCLHIYRTASIVKTICLALLLSLMIARAVVHTSHSSITISPSPVIHILVLNQLIDTSLTISWNTARFSLFVHQTQNI